MTPAPPNPSRRDPRSVARARLHAVALALAVLAGTGARVATADWGLPFSFHVDERGFVVHEALATEWRGLRHGDWTPRINTYGSAVIFGVIGVHLATQGGLDRARAVARRAPNEHVFIGEFGFQPDDDAPYSMPALLHALRLLAALTGGLAILFVGLAAGRLAGASAGVAAGWLTAFTVGLLQVGHFYTAEALMLLPQAVFLWACTHLGRRRAWAWIGVAGVALGVAAAVKMPALAIAAALPACLLPSVSRLRPRHVLGVLRTPALWLVPLVALATYRAANPFPFEHPEIYFEGVAGNRDGATVLAEQYVPRTFGFLDWRAPWTGTRSYLYTLTRVLPIGAGWAWILALGGALAVGWRLRRPTDRLVWLAVVPTFALVGGWAVQTVRYGLPAYLPATVGIAALVTRSRRRWARGLAVAAILLTVVQGAAFAGIFTRPDPRVQAAEWLAARGSRGDTVALEYEAAYSAPLNTRGSGLGWREDLQTPARVVRLWGAPSTATLEGALDALEGADFLVTSEWYERRAAATAGHEAQAELYARLAAGALPFREVAHFDPAPALGPLRWPEAGMDPMSVCFDHCAVRIWQRSEPSPGPR
ncbi:MAG: hypothetical protein CMN30_22475 [Sandaracinus sp.]|nr:hypothetical protein [Sandaracinus sp.]